jgi:hypothetical protein
MTFNAVVVCVLAASLTAFNQPAAAQLPAYRLRVLGVFDSQTGDPVEGAQVTDLMSKTSALTTVTGTVALSYLPDGGSLVRIQKIGYTPQTLMVAISPADTIPITIALVPLAQTLPTVVTRDSAPTYISPGLQAFEERRKLGFGHFITEAELRKNDYKKMTTVVMRFPSVRIICPTKGQRQGECFAVGTRSATKLGILGGLCEIDVYIDGIVSTDNDLQKLDVNEFAAVEYYGGGATIPMQYNRTGSACGVMLFWHRER